MWLTLDTKEGLQELIAASHNQPQAIFKHSTRCSISSMAKNRLDRAGKPDGITLYYLDLLKHRELSNDVADVFGVMHESPQILLIKNGECIYDESHSGISMGELSEQLIS